MLSDDGNIIVAFNGEICNAYSFTASLQDAGHTFRGTSDTEVLLRLFEQFGLEGMLSRINGMFAIVIINLRQRTLTLIREWNRHQATAVGASGEYAAVRL